MAKTVEIRPLVRDDDRGGFTCGQADLDRYFEHYAGQNEFKLHLSVTLRGAGGGTHPRVCDRRTVFDRARIRSDRSLEKAASELTLARPPARAPRRRYARAGPRHRPSAPASRPRLGARPRRPARLRGSGDQAQCGDLLEGLGFQALEGVREGLLVSEPLPMFLGIETIATALAP